jgi:hypothetical protein
VQRLGFNNIFAVQKKKKFARKKDTETKTKKSEIYRNENDI